MPSLLRNGHEETCPPYRAREWAFIAIHSKTGLSLPTSPRLLLRRADRFPPVGNVAAGSEATPSGQWEPQPTMKDVAF